MGFRNAKFAFVHILRNFKVSRFFMSFLASTPYINVSRSASVGAIKLIFLPIECRKPGLYEDIYISSIHCTRGVALSTNVVFFCFHTLPLCEAIMVGGAYCDSKSEGYVLFL